MAIKSVAERRKVKQEAIAKLNEEIQGLIDREASRIAKIAVRAGLADLTISDKDLLAAFKEIAARFQNGKAKSPPQATAETGQN